MRKIMNSAQTSTLKRNTSSENVQPNVQSTYSTKE